MWSGSVWVRVWIGPEVNPNVCACYSLDGPWKGKGSCAGSKCTAWLLRRRTTCNRVSLAVPQPGGATIAVWLLHCLHYNKCSFEIWQLGSVALQQFVLAAWNGESLQATKPKNMQPSLDHTLTHQYIISFRKYGSPRFEKPGSFLGPRLKPDLRFWAATKWFCRGHANLATGTCLFSLMFDSMEPVWRTPKNHRRSRLAVHTDPN